jgi:hypothetical protein
MYLNHVRSLVSLCVHGHQAGPFDFVDEFQQKRVISSDVVVWHHLSDLFIAHHCFRGSPEGPSSVDPTFPEVSPRKIASMSKFEDWRRL